LHFSENYATEEGDFNFEEIEPRLFSFNSPHGACPECHGLGTKSEFDPELIVPDESLSLENGAIEAWRKNGKRMNIYYSRVLRQFARDFGFSPSIPYKDIPKKAQQVLMYGTDAKGDLGTGTWFEGVIPNLQRRFENTESEFVKTRLHQYMSEQPCVECGGTRLKKEALAVRLHTRNLLPTGAIEMHTPGVESSNDVAHDAAPMNHGGFDAVATPPEESKDSRLAENVASRAGKSGKNGKKKNGKDSSEGSSVLGTPPS